MSKTLFKLYTLPLVVVLYLMAFSKPTNKLAHKIVASEWFTVDVVIAVQSLVYVVIYQSIV